MSNKPPTSLANTSYFGTGNDKSNLNTQFYYKNNKNLPWAIDIIHDFAVPKETYEITRAYPYFSKWAETSGNNYKDWYKEKSGYRNANYLK